MRLAACFRERPPYSRTPALNLCGRVSLRCCLALDLPLFQAFFAAALMSSLILVLCTDFSLYCVVDSPMTCSCAAFLASSSALSFPAMSMCPGTHLILNSRFGLRCCRRRGPEGFCVQCIVLIVVL